MTAHTEKVIGIIRGKAISGRVPQEDLIVLFEHIDALEALLDEDDSDDIHGTEGWRHHLNCG